LVLVRSLSRSLRARLNDVALAADFRLALARPDGGKPYQVSVAVRSLNSSSTAKRRGIKPVR
jgi:hypothetical protein